MKKAYFVLLFVTLFCLSFLPLLAQISPEDKEESITSTYYIGNRKCMICHPKHFQMWHEEKHAQGFESLGKMYRNPYCLKCHTTGFAEKGGYIDQEITPQMKGVQCEACHGPGSEHKVAPRDKKSLTINTHIDYEHTCRRCHDKDWDPKFDYPTYREKIEHRLGEEKF